MKGKLFFDGASKGNPGPSSYGYVLELEGDEVEGCGFIGISTNNVAEYTALIEGLKKALSMGIKKIEIFSDSQLVVNQLLGKYKVKAEHLVPLHNEALRLLKSFEDVRINFIRRELNKRADALANRALKDGAGGWAVAGVEPEESPGPAGQGAG